MKLKRHSLTTLWGRRNLTNHRYRKYVDEDDVAKLESELAEAREAREQRFFHITGQGFVCPICKRDSLVVYSGEDNQGTVNCNYSACAFSRSKQESKDETER